MVNLIVITTVYRIMKKKNQCKWVDMKVDVDIEIYLSNVASSELSSLTKQFLIKSTNKYAGGKLQDIVIRQEADNRTGIVDHIVRDFLNNMT